MQQTTRPPETKRKQLESDFKLSYRGWKPSKACSVHKEHLRLLRASSGNEPGWGRGWGGQSEALWAQPAGPTRSKPCPFHPRCVSITYFRSLLFGLFQFVHFNLLGFGCKDKRGCYESSRNSFHTSLSLAATPAILFEALRWPLGLHGLQCKGSGPGAVHLLSGLSSQAPADSCPVGMREAQCGLPSQGPREAGIMNF